MTDRRFELCVCCMKRRAPDQFNGEGNVNCCLTCVNEIQSWLHQMELESESVAAERTSDSGESVSVD